MRKTKVPRLERHPTKNVAFVRLPMPDGRRRYVYFSPAGGRSLARPTQGAAGASQDHSAKPASRPAGLPGVARAEAGDHGVTRTFLSELAATLAFSASVWAQGQPQQRRPKAIKGGEKEFLRDSPDQAKVVAATLVGGNPPRSRRAAWNRPVPSTPAAPRRPSCPLAAARKAPCLAATGPFCRYGWCRRGGSTAVWRRRWGPQGGELLLLPACISGVLRS